MVRFINAKSSKTLSLGGSLNSSKKHTHTYMLERVDRRLQFGTSTKLQSKLLSVSVSVSVYVCLCHV